MESETWQKLFRRKFKEFEDGPFAAYVAATTTIDIEPHAEIKKQWQRTEVLPGPENYSGHDH